jgi:hypothetical protein
VTTIEEMYPKTDNGNKKVRSRIMSMKGEKIVVYLPYYLRNAYYSKTFEFLIEDISIK